MKQENSDFFNRVYDIVSKIPEGSVITYGLIAKMLGRPRAARIVGYAMHGAPAERKLPCHRVVDREGRMAPGEIFGGQDKQRELLESEGVVFKENGCIDMEKHMIRLSEEKMNEFY